VFPITAEHSYILSAAGHGGDNGTAPNGHHVYRADVGDSEAVVHDGQDRDTIDAVRRDCEYVGLIRIRGRRT
jgi:hypothetical protein